MKFSWFLALRYLKPKRTFISIITVISVLGVALGVGVLIVVIAVMSGFEKRIKDEWLKVEPPLYLHDDTRSFFTAEPKEGDSTEPDWRELLPKVKSFPGVENASPFINVVAIMQQGKPKSSQTSIDVKPEDLPPPEPPAANDSSPDAPPPPEPPSRESASGVQSDSPTAGEPSASTPQDPPVPTPADPASGEPAPAHDLSDAAGEKESVTGLDRTRPFAHAYIIGVDTDDVVQMEKHRRRFEELRNRRSEPHGNPQAGGEFDLGGDSIVLSEDTVIRLYRGSDNEFPTVGSTMYNLFGPGFLYKGIDIMEENREAKNDPVKKAEVENKDREYPLPEELTVTGIFNDDKQQMSGQAGIGYVSLKTAQRLAGADKAVDGIFVDLADPYDAPAMAEKLNDSGLLPPGWRTETWLQRHRQQFEAVQNERSMMYIVLGFISVVAAFCIMNTMITMAVQKRREIGMMRALGAKTSHIVSLFMTKGFIVGFFGTGLGYGLGLLVLHYRNGIRSWINDRFGHQIFDSSIYGLSEIPAELRNLDEIMICGLAFILCTLAAVPPAWMVGRMEPARALRNDR